VRSNEVALTSRVWFGDVGVSTVKCTSSMSPGDRWTGEVADAIDRTQLLVKQTC